jgi:colanic acid/amylovoran biosynthesis protein
VRDKPMKGLGDGAGLRVSLMGASLHTANRGVSALAASLATLIWQSHPDAAVSLLIGNRDDTSAAIWFRRSERIVTTVNYRLSPRAPLEKQLWWIILLAALYRAISFRPARRFLLRSNSWVRAVAEADFVGDIRGGDSFSDIYGVRNFLVDCIAVMSVIWIRGGIHLLPQTYGPFRSKVSERLARHILLRAESIWCRDEVSQQEVSRLTDGKRGGSLCPDVAFALEAMLPENLGVDVPLRPTDAELLIGVNVSGLVYHGGYSRANMFGLKLDYQAFVIELIEQFLSDTRYRILLVPHTFAADGRVESDPGACQEVKRRVSSSVRGRVHVVTEAYDQHHIKGVIGLCDFFIGSRMHACIAALSQGIPTVGVAYSRKFAGVFETVGSADWVIDGRSTVVEDALTRLQDLFRQRTAQSMFLRARVTDAQSELASAFRRIFEPRRSDDGSCHLVSNRPHG